MEERHRLLLIKQNPWWTGKEKKIPNFKRDLFEKMVTYADYKQIIAITGLRRVGKTVLMQQVIENLGAKKNNICYISFDDIDFQKYTTAEELINYFLEFSDQDEVRYLFLDEVQKLPHWPSLLKILYDTEDKLKMYISGSASLDLHKNKETLAGRILTFYLPVLTFREFVRYRGMEHSFRGKELFREYDLTFADKKERYRRLFEEYLYKGAFPELLGKTDSEFISKYISESVVEKAILDISRITGEDEKLIFELFRLLANSNARLFEIANLSNILKVNRNKVSRVIGLLEKSFLIQVVYNYTASVARQVRTSKKQYLAHSSLVMALLDYPFEVIHTEAAGYLVEGVVANSMEKSGFWRTPQKDEVDIVTMDRLPVEVKYRSQITKNDVKSLLKFCRKFDVNRGIMVTKDLLDMREIDGRKVLLIPAWVFLLYWDGELKMEE